MITITTAQRNSLQIARKGITLARLFYGDETADTDYIALSTQALPPEWTDNEYRPLLIDSPVVSSGVDMYTHKFKVSLSPLNISNGDYHPGVKFSDLLGDTSLGSGSDVGFENRACEIRLQTPGIATWNNCIQLFKGNVREPRHDEKALTFSVRDKREADYIDIDHTLTSTDATYPEEGLPESAVDDVKDVIYGDRFFGKGNDSKTLDTFIQDNGMVKAKFLGAFINGRTRWQISNHKLDDATFSGIQSNLWTFDTTLGRFVRIFNIQGSTNTSSGATVELFPPVTTEYIDYFYPDTIATSTSGTVTDYDDDSKTIDKDGTTKATCSIDANSSAGAFVKLKATYDTWGRSADTTVSDIDGLIFGKVTFAGGADAADTTLEMDDTTTVVTGVGEPTNEDARTDYGPLTLSIAGASLETELQFTSVNNLAGGESATLDVFSIYKAIRYKDTLNNPTTIFFGGRGREYGSWINSRTGTETHADNGQENALIENMAGIIESVARDEMALGDSNIDEDAFNVASNDNTDNFVATVLKVEPSIDVIEKLASDSRSFVWTKSDGTITMKVLENTYSTSDRTLDFKTLSFNGFPFKRTRAERITTAVKVSYLFNGSKYGLETTIAEDTTMQARYKITRAQSTLPYKANNILESTTATNLRAYLLAQWKQPHNEIKFSAGLEHIDLDIGDIIELSNTPYKVFGEDVTANATRAGQTIYKFWWIFDVKRSATGVTIEAMQLHDLS